MTPIPHKREGSARVDHAEKSTLAGHRSNGGLNLTVPPELLELLAEQVAERVAELVASREVGAEQPAEARAGGRLAMTKADAADALGVSVDHLKRHVLPELRTVRSGRLRLIPVAELERWLDERAGRALGDRR